MVVHLTESVGSTHPDARVAALLVNTGLGELTVHVSDTLRLTGLLGVPYIARDARTHRSVGCHTAFRVGAARGRHAGSNWTIGGDLAWLYGLRHRTAAGVRVACEAGWAGTDRPVFNNLTKRVYAAGPRARINTEAVDAGGVVWTVIM